LRVTHHLPIRRAVKNVRAESLRLAGRAGKIRLDMNENTSGCSLEVCRAISRLRPAEISMYPRYERTTRAIARFLRVRPGEIALTNGADDALRTIFDVFVDSGSAVAFPEPTFPMYRFLSEVFGARPLTARFDSAMRFPVQDILALLRRRPRVLFLANPNNPTGTLLSRNSLRSILHAATHTAVVVDEAYVEFSRFTVVPWIRRYPHLVVVRTFSKAAGLAGLRLGCLVARSEVAELFRRVMPPFPANVAALAAAEAAIRDRAAVRKYVRGVQRERHNLAKALARMGVKTFPSAANFLLADFGPEAPELVRRLEREGILISDRSPGFGRPGPVRITIGTPREMQKLIRAIQNHL
jgi:histidinol-phosphate aminotransferase